MLIFMLIYVTQFMFIYLYYVSSTNCWVGTPTSSDLFCTFSFTPAPGPPGGPPGHLRGVAAGALLDADPRLEPFWSLSPPCGHWSHPQARLDHPWCASLNGQLNKRVRVYFSFNGDIFQHLRQSFQPTDEWYSNEHAHIVKTSDRQSSTA